MPWEFEHALYLNEYFFSQLSKTYRTRVAFTPDHTVTYQL